MNDHTSDGPVRLVRLRFSEPNLPEVVARRLSAVVDPGSLADAAFLAAVGGRKLPSRAVIGASKARGVVSLHPHSLLSGCTPSYLVLQCSNTS